MSGSHELHHYGYVHRPYERVRALLRREPLELFQRATTSAASRAEALVANLHIGGEGLHVGVDVCVHIDRTVDEPPVAGMPPLVYLDLSWQAAKGSGFFPLLRAQLSASPITAAETQVAFDGHYAPPLGALGAAVDAVLGHRIAQATVDRFLQDVLEQIRRDLP